jgi:hypothetical protein
VKTVHHYDEKELEALIAKAIETKKIKMKSVKLEATGLNLDEKINLTISAEVEVENSKKENE